MGARKSREVPPTQHQHTTNKSTTTKRDVDFAAFPARVDSVNISGLGRTCDDYVRKAAEDLFKATNFQEVIAECNNARQYLNELGIFKDIRINIDVSKGEKATDNGYEITFEGNELSRIVGGIGTEIGQNEGALTSELASPNIWGRGERVSVQFSYSNCKTTDVNVKLTKPYYHTILKNYRPEVSLGVFRHAATFPVSAYRTLNTGLLTDFSFLTFAPFELSHSLQYEMSFRELFTASKRTPFFVREHCGPRMISLFRIVTAYDQRDSIMFPTQGLHVKTTNEFSGFGGNIAYMMNNTHAELSIPLFAGFVGQISAKLGLIQVEKQAKELPLSSLFTLGGPLTIRGFKHGGVGPHTDGYACGVHSYWAIGMHLWTPLPFHSYLGRIGNNLRSHFFYNFGNCNSFSIDNMRSAAGLGVAYRFGERARIEFNYCFPMQRQRGDQVQRGFQFGIGYEFL